MFEAYKIYRNRNCLDVDLMILNTNPERPGEEESEKDGLWVYGIFVFRKDRNLFAPSPEYYFIKHKDFHNWSLVSDEE